MSIEARLVHKYQVFMTNGRHSIVADEPPKANGTDIGPNPYDLLLGSLAACKAITVRMYAEHKAWPLEGIDLTLGHRRVKAQQYDPTRSDNGTVDIIDCEMVFHGALDEAQKERLLEIAERCPVQRTLLGELVIDTRQRQPVPALVGL